MCNAIKCILRDYVYYIIIMYILDVVKVFIIKSLFKKLWLTFENNDDKKLFKYFDILIVENFKKFGNTTFVY